MEGTPRSLDRGGGEQPARRGLGWFVALALCSLLFTQIPTTPARADEDPNQLRREIEQLERAIQVSRRNAERYRQASQQYQNAAAAAAVRIRQLAEKQRNAESEAEELAAEIGIAEEQLALVTLQLNETVAHLEALAAAIDEGAKMLARREQLYGQHLRQMYRQSRVSPLEMLLSSGSLADFVERVQLVGAIARQDQQLAADLRKLKASNEEKKVTADLKRQETEALKALVTSQRNRLKEQKARLDALIADTAYAKQLTQIQRSSATRNARLSQDAAHRSKLEAGNLQQKLAQAEARYAALVAQLQRTSGIAAVWGGRLAAWPLSGPITSYFGPRWGGFHNGLDIAAPMYAPIRAAHSGVVQVAGRPYLASGDTAVVVIVAHASNMSTLYGHMDDLRWPVVRSGQWVAAGQVLGYVGMTGWTTGPHLHFMTIFNGVPVNPLSYLP